MDFGSPNDIFALRDMLDDPNETAMREQELKGSVLNPGTIGGGQNKKEIAAPFTKINVKKNTREVKTNATKNDNIIWEPEEIKDIPIEKNETRPRPEFECIFKQNVNAMDVYHHLGDMDQSSDKCQNLLMKIKLPNTKLQEIQFDVTQSVCQLQTPQYFLHHILPYNVNDKEGNCKWVSDLHELHVTLPIVKESMTFEH